MDNRNYNDVIKTALEMLRAHRNIVHQITNQVTMHDCANIVLAIGASPIMASHPEEVAEVTRISKALVLNIGTIEEEVAKAMLIAARAANDSHIPIVFDPVGVGVSRLRQQLTSTILDSFTIGIIRCNASELQSIYTGSRSSSGVDATSILEDGFIVDSAMAVAKRYDTVVAVTGEVDYVTDGNRVVSLHNGVDLLPQLTGTGCMTTALTGAYLTVAEPFVAAIAGITTMSVCGEMAAVRLSNSTQLESTKWAMSTLGSFSVYLHDAIGDVSPDELGKRGIIKDEVK